MNYPDDLILLARGKYATLSTDRREQMRRVQAICSTLVTAAQATLRDCEAMPPATLAPLLEIEKCLENLKDAREKIVKLATKMNAIKPEAWPQ